MTTTTTAQTVLDTAGADDVAPTPYFITYTDPANAARLITATLVDAGIDWTRDAGHDGVAGTDPDDAQALTVVTAALRTPDFVLTVDATLLFDPSARLRWLPDDDTDDDDVSERATRDGFPELAHIIRTQRALHTDLTDPERLRALADAIEHLPEPTGHEQVPWLSRRADRRLAAEAVACAAVGASPLIARTIATAVQTYPGSVLSLATAVAAAA